MPFDTHQRVAFPTRASLQAIADPYFRGFDLRFADAWRVAEWRRELDGYVASGRLQPVIESVFPLEQAGDGVRLLEDRKIFGKVIIKP